MGGVPVDEVLYSELPRPGQGGAADHPIGRWSAEGPVNTLHHLSGQGAFLSKHFQGVVGLPARIVLFLGVFHGTDDAVRISLALPDVKAVDELGSEDQPGELHENIKDLFASGSTTDTRYCICSHPADAATILGNWSIENSLHWVLDVAFDEDHSRVRTGHADRNLSVIRHWALNLLKQERSTKVGIKVKRSNASWDFNYMLKVLSL